jgi:F-type H+-transporting ATPase subunit delta
LIEETVTGKYAKALLEIAAEENKIDQIQSELEWVDTLVENNRVIMRFFSNPVIPAKKKKELIDKIIAPEVSGRVRDFLYLVVDRKRTGILDYLLDEFKSRANKLKGAVKAEVETTIPLSPEKIDRLRKNLASVFKMKVMIETKIVPSIIGGLKIRVGSKIIDATLTNRLKNIKERLLTT